MESLMLKFQNLFGHTELLNSSTPIKHIDLDLQISGFVMASSEALPRVRIKGEF
jgi:hypothetical protein